MIKIDANEYIEKSALRKARFGGYEPDDVRRMVRELCSTYEQAVAESDQQTQQARSEADALRRRCQTLLGQTQSLTAQSAALAAKADQLAGEHTDWQTRYNKVQERNHSLNDQVAVLRLKNNDLTRENKDLAEKAADAAAALRIKGRSYEDARRQLEADRDKVLAEAQSDAARIRRQAQAEADSLQHRSELKSQAIEKLAREEAHTQAQKLVQAATDEAREIQNAHRLRLEDLQHRVAEMQEKRAAALDGLAKMIGELQEVQDFARRDSAPIPTESTIPMVADVPELELSEDKIEAETRALYEQENPAPEQEPEKTETPPAAKEEPAPAEEPQPKQPIEIPGAIFSYPIIHPAGEEPDLPDNPPPAAPRAPLMPELPKDPDTDSEAEDTGIHLIPEKQPAPDPRRAKALAAMRSLRKKMADKE